MEPKREEKTIVTTKGNDADRGQETISSAENQFTCGEAVMQRMERVEGKKSQWQTFVNGINGFTDDVFADGRDQGILEKREDF